MIDGLNFLHRTVKNNLRTNDNIQKIATGQGDDYKTGCLSDYNYFNEYYEMIAIKFGKQQALDTDPKQYNKLNLQEI